MNDVFKDFQFLAMDCKRLSNGKFKDKIKGWFKIRNLKKSIDKTIKTMPITAETIRHFNAMYVATAEDLTINGIEFIPSPAYQFENFMVIDMREDRKIAIGYKDTIKELNYLSISIGYDGINHFSGDKIVMKNDDGSMVYDGTDEKKKAVVVVVTDLLRDIFKQYTDMYIERYI